MPWHGKGSPNAGAAVGERRPAGKRGLAGQDRLHGHLEAPGARPEGAEAWPDAFAVSPAIGPLPAIYVPPSPSQATAPGLLGHATVRAGGWAECCRGDS